MWGELFLEKAQRRSVRPREVWGGGIIAVCFGWGTAGGRAAEAAETVRG